MRNSYKFNFRFYCHYKLVCYTYIDLASVPEDEPESGSEQDGPPDTYTKEEEDNLLKSDSDDMDIDGESFHSAQGGRGR